ncbi:MAG: hypothetical protein Tsb0016_23040 [Sphingomonadales bacterium]
MILARAAFGLVALLSVTLPAQAGQWEMMAPESRLGFVFLLQGDEKQGHFERFAADIQFDPDNLATSQVTVDIDLASVRAGDGERNTMLADKDWFHINAFPKARFQTTGFTALGEGRYEAAAMLTIKGISRDVVLPFSLDIEGDVAHVVGSLRFQRTAFEVGDGGWAKGDVVGLPVTVKVDIKARRAAP